MKHFLVAMLLVWWVSPAQAGAPVCPPAWGAALDGYPIDAGRLNLVRAETGLTPRLVGFFLQWPRPGEPGEIPLASLEAISQAGALPILTLEPMYLDAAGKEQAVPAGDITSGAYDGYLAGLAQGIKTWGKPLIVRFAHEMNLKRYHWGTTEEAYGPPSTDLYKRMFRHVVTVMRRQGADNIRWAFCPNAESQPHPRWNKAAWNTASAYWPGRDFVDILGMDGYNWGTSRTMKAHGWQSRWMSFADIFKDLKDELTRLAPDKPLLVFETSCALAGGDRGIWLAGALEMARQWNLQGLVWFQAAKEVDWRLMAERDAAALGLLRPTPDCSQASGDLFRPLGFNRP